MDNKLIRVLITNLIGLMLLPVLVTFVGDLTGTGGALETSDAAPIINFIPTLFIFGLITYDVVSLIGAKKG